jgi:hypothetical protein
VKGGLTTIPYNEVYVRVGGLGRISGGVDVSTGKTCSDADGSGRTFDLGKIISRYPVEPHAEVANQPSCQPHRCPSQNR